MLIIAGYSLHREKKENHQKKCCQGTHREFQNFAKTQGIWFAPVVHSLIQMVKDIVIFAAEISIFFQKLDRFANLVLCML